MESHLKQSEVTRRIIGCAFEVHKRLGSGFPEAVYQRALVVEMEVQEMRFVRELEIPVFYRDTHVGTRRVDFLVEDLILVELKAISKLDDLHLAQGLNYLEAFKLEVGLLINFGSRSLEFKRLMNTHKLDNNSSQL